MKYWRMAMKMGSRGIPMWPRCQEFGVAAITYSPVINVDFTLFPRENKPDGWNGLHPTQKSSLEKLVYDFSPGDVIYVKDGGMIVSKGKIQTKYFYDYSNNIIDDDGDSWPHQVKVNWDKSFPQIEILLGAEHHTVHELSSKNVEDIENRVVAIPNLRPSIVLRDEIELFDEGARFKEEQEFRKRNSLLIKKKKDASDYKCEVCGFNFGEFYGNTGANFIEAHHLIMIADGKRKSSMDDIALICSNCHSMVHKRKPPYSIEEVRIMIGKK